MPEKNTIKLLTVVICDDIRYEKNNKPFIIGIYPNDIILEYPKIQKTKPGEEDIPALLNLSLWVPFEPKGFGDAEFEIRILGPFNKQERLLKGKVSIPADRPTYETSALTLHSLPFEIPLNKSVVEGEIEIQFRNKGAKSWKTFKKAPVKIKQIQ